MRGIQNVESKDMAATDSGCGLLVVVFFCWTGMCFVWLPCLWLVVLLLLLLLLLIFLLLCLPRVMVVCEPRVYSGIHDLSVDSRYHLQFQVIENGTRILRVDVIFGWCDNHSSQYHDMIGIQRLLHHRQQWNPNATPYSIRR
jgi:hypothetical protein